MFEAIALRATTCTMPSKEEINLFCNFGGKTQDPDASEVLQVLSQVAQVPGPQLKAFVKTRDKTTIKGLQKVLQGMPKVPPAVVQDLGKPLSKEAAEAAAAKSKLRRGSTAPASFTQLSIGLGSTSSSKRSKEENAERLSEMMSMTSSYHSAFSPGGIQVPKHPRPHANAFAHFTDSFKQSIDDWKRTASEPQLKTIAEASRAIQYYAKTDASMTTYGDLYPRYSKDDMNASRVQLPEKDASSKIPIGNVGKVSESEKAAKKARDKLFETQMEMLKERQKAIQNGELTRPEKRSNMGASHLGNMVEPKKAQEVGADQGVPAPSRDWQASARASWANDPHTDFQVKRHALSSLKQGEYERKDLQRRELFARTLVDRGKVGKGDHVFNVSNPKDHTGNRVSRFTYSKWAGFVP